MDFGSRIKRRRIELGYTLEYVGGRVGVTKATVQRWESGSIKNLRKDKLEPLARVLHTSTAYLLGATDVPNSTDGMADFFNSTFRERLGWFLSCVDSADLQIHFGTTAPYEDIISGASPLTLDMAFEISNECSLPLTWLFGLTDDPYETISAFGKACDEKGFVDLGLLAKLFMKTESLSQRDAEIRAEQYVKHFEGHDKNEDELYFYFHNAPPELQKAALAVLKSAIPTKTTDTVDSQEQDDDTDKK